MKLAGINTDQEATIFLIYKVCNHYITAYMYRVSHHSRPWKALHAIICNIHAHNFYMGTQVVIDSGVTIMAKAILEVKMYNECP